MAFLKLRRSIYPAASRSVCNWICGYQTVRRRISTCCSAAPWLLIEDDGLNNNSFNFYSIGDECVKKESKDGRAKDATVVGSSHGWLALYEMGPNPLNELDMFLYNPGTNRYVDLPSLQAISLNKEDYEDLEETSLSPLIFNQEDYLDLPLPLILNLKDILNNYRPRKLILSCSPDDEDNCRAIMSCGPEDRLACCCPNQSNKWTFFNEHEPINEKKLCSLNWFPRRIYKDFVYSSARNKLFCINRYDNFECWDLQDPLSPKMIWRLGDEKTSKRRWRYLVFAEQIDSLFVVYRNVEGEIGPDGGGYDGPYQTTGFDVYELIVDPDTKGGELIFMEATLNGMSFFIGSTGHGFVIEPNEDNKMIKNVEPNSIYFTDPKELTPPLYSKNRVTTYGGHDIGIFNYENRTFSPCYYPCDLRNVKKNILPTPTWFVPSTPS